MTVILFELNVRRVATDHETVVDVDAERIINMIGPNTHAIVLNSPSNPTGTVYPRETIEWLCQEAAYRGVETTLIVPALNDSRIVSAASRSYYAELIAAGVKLYEFSGGLLHAKTLTVDGELTLIGSANMDRRSLDLNYENNILVHDAELTAALRARQADYVGRSTRVTREAVEAWPMTRRLWNNAIATLGPLF